MPQQNQTNHRLSPGTLLIIATVFHLLFTLSIFALARQGAFPATFDSNGIAISFAPDGILLQPEAARLGETLRRGQLRDWFSANSPFHIKLYSISFALLAPLLGPNILSAEPVNLICYLAILVIVFRLGAATFNRRVGLIAATTVALWPSLLLHTTQLLKDPQFVVGTLGFILVILLLLSRTIPWSRALLLAAAGGLTAILIWFVRDNMGHLTIAIAMLGLALLIVRQFRERRFHAANVLGLALIVLLSAGIVRFVPKFEADASSRPELDQTARANIKGKGPLTRVNTQIGIVRRRFIYQYPDAASNIDAHVSLATTAELIRYVPRAAVIGFLAPFPNMWVSDGSQVGSAGRRLSGLEMIGIYLVEVLALVGLLRWRRERAGPADQSEFSIWLLALVAALGMLALGLVVANIGALYRLRYAYMILLIILAAEGAMKIFDWLSGRPGSRVSQY